MIQLLEYSKGGVSNFLDIDYRGFPWGSIISYFTEVIGPIACIYGDLLSQYILDPDILKESIALVVAKSCLCEDLAAGALFP